MDDDALQALHPRKLPEDLQSWNLEDLEGYIKNLKAEINRVEAKIKEKQAVGAAAASLFKS